MRTKNYSDLTVAQRSAMLGLFVAWCVARSVFRPESVTKAILESYQRHLFYLRREDGRALSFASQRTRVVAVRALFRWLTRQNVLASNPAGDLDLPRLEHRLPRNVLTASEAERVLMQPDVHDALGLRDRAILEVLYSTGMRRMEVAGLLVGSIDVERGTILIRQGKGKRDRMVPIGERAAAWVEKYVADARPLLLVPPDEGVLFLTQMGDPFTVNRLSKLVKEYVARAELGKTGACHLFRHTMATVMLEGGADIRFIQEMLGHADLSTTQIYTRVSIRKLKEVHARTHPGAKLGGTSEE
jgi:integrase/recombinase XerD